MDGHPLVAFCSATGPEPLGADHTSHHRGAQFAPPGEKNPSPRKSGKDRGRCANVLKQRSDGASLKSRANGEFTVTDTAAEGMPFAIATSELAPVSMCGGTSKFVETVFFPVA